MRRPCSAVWGKPAPLRAALPCRPFLVKPNSLELGEFFGVGRALREEAEVLSCARQLQARGARNVLVSMAGVELLGLSLGRLLSVGLVLSGGRAGGTGCGAAAGVALGLGMDLAAGENEAGGVPKKPDATMVFQTLAALAVTPGRAVYVLF